MSTSTPTTPTHRAGDAVALVERGASAAPRPRVQRRADRARRRACATVGDERARTRATPSRRVRGGEPRERVGDVGRRTATATTIPTARPAHDVHAPHEPEPVPDPAAAPRRPRATTRSRKFTPPGREQPGVGEEAGVRHHAVVGPHRLAVDVPGALQHLERLDHAERRARELLAQARHLDDRRQVGEQDPARVQRALGVLHDPPRLGQVEQDAVEVVDVDAVVDVAHLDVERDVGAEEALDVGCARGGRSRRGSRSR